jgi:hypothetical protein
MTPNKRDDKLIADIYDEYRCPYPDTSKLITTYRAEIEVPLKAEIETLRCIAKGNAVTADQWKREAERFKAERDVLLEALKRICDWGRKSHNMGPSKEAKNG